MRLNAISKLLQNGMHRSPIIATHHTARVGGATSSYACISFASLVTPRTGSPCKPSNPAWLVDSASQHNIAIAPFGCHRAVCVSQPRITQKYSSTVGNSYWEPLLHKNSNTHKPPTHPLTHSPTHPLTSPSHPLTSPSHPLTHPPLAHLLI